MEIRSCHLSRLPAGGVYNRKSRAYLSSSLPLSHSPISYLHLETLHLETTYPSSRYNLRGHETNEASTVRDDSSRVLLPHHLTPIAAQRKSPTVNIEEDRADNTFDEILGDEIRIPSLLDVIRSRA